MKDKASDEVDALKNKAKEVGREALNNTNSAAHKLADHVDDAVDTAKSKVDKA
ncbi:hypothetical protein D3C80_2129150 [compost metagenome]